MVIRQWNLTSGDVLKSLLTSNLTTTALALAIDAVTTTTATTAITTPAPPDPRHLPFHIASTTSLASSTHDTRQHTTLSQTSSASHASTASHAHIVSPVPSSLVTHAYTAIVNTTLDAVSAITYDGSASTGEGDSPLGTWNYSPGLCVLIGAILGLVVMVTVLGNCLVCVTVLTDRRMHSPTNLFILSLAGTDLCLGVLVLPFSVHTTLRSNWPFGAVFCNLYVSLDVTLCTVSILALFAISLDRYCALSWPLRYQTKMNARIGTFFVIINYIL